MTKLIYLNDDFDATVDRILQDKDLTNAGLNKENISKTLVSFEGDEIATSVFYKKYALRDENNIIIEFTLNEAKNRWAKAISEAESLFPGEKKDFTYFRELYDYFLPGGRQMFGLGNNYVKNITFSNCYVTAIEEDSIEGIFDAAKKCARTYSYGGGIGVCLEKLRPKNSKVSNSAKFSTGAVSFMELFSMTTGLIGQQGRRGALLLSIPIYHPDIEDFIEIKHNNINKIKYANISIKLTNDFMKAVEEDKDFLLHFETKHEKIQKFVSAKKLWDKIITSSHNSGEPGLLFWDKAVEMSPSDSYPNTKIHTTNPCLTGDTMIYVADGRGNVSIKELAEKGEDVPVFCLNDEKDITIKTMRNPRVTGFNQPIYKVIFDDGNFIKITGNHKFLLKSGEYKEVKDLQNGDSLYIITKFASSLTDVISRKISNRQDYYFIESGKKRILAEHTLIADFYNPGQIYVGKVVHHKDFNGINNFPNNLQIMTQKEHRDLHTKIMFTENNPMKIMKREWTEERWKKYSKDMSDSVSGEKNGQYSGITNEELKQHAIILTKQLGIRFSEDDWLKYAKENNLIVGFGKYRKKSIGNIKSLARWAAVECGLENIDLDPRIQKKYLKLTKKGYECKIVGKTLYIIKTCKICGRKYELFYRYEKSEICSTECHTKYMQERSKNVGMRNKMNEGIHSFFDIFRADIGKKQIEIFLQLKQLLNRDPVKREFIIECRKQKVPFATKKNSCFSGYKKLKEAASRYNHKVVSVEFIGYGTVYNGTVDDFHNYFIGGFEGITDKQKKKFSYFNTLNCGEQFLHKDSNCTLGSLLLHKFVINAFTEKAYFDFDNFKKIIKMGVRHLDNITELNIGIHPLKEQNEAARGSRRIGLGITGLADMLAALCIKYDSQKSLDIVNSIMEIKKITEYEESISLAKERGSFPLYNPNLHFNRGFAATLPNDVINKAKINGLRNVTISTIAPSGSISIIAQCSSGCEPIYALNYKRNVMCGKEGKKQFFINHPGVTRFFNITNSKILPNYWITAHDIDYKFRVELQSILQRHVDSSISITVNLPSNISKEVVGQIYMDAWKKGLKGITVYREGSREGVLVTDEYNKQMGIPELDTSIHCVRAEGGDKFYVMISYKNRDITQPYQVFVMNYKKSENDGFIKIANALIKMLKENGVPEKRIDKYIARSNNSLVKLTRFLSLSMKTGNLENALKVLDENAFAGTLASKLYTILKKSVKSEKFVCPSCNSSDNIKMEEGCVSCKNCGWSKCS